MENSKNGMVSCVGVYMDELYSNAARGVNSAPRTAQGVVGRQVLIAFAARVADSG